MQRPPHTSQSLLSRFAKTFNALDFSTNFKGLPRGKIETFSAARLALYKNLLPVMQEGIVTGDGDSLFTRGKSLFRWTRLSIAIPSWIPPKHGQLQHQFTVLFLSTSAAVTEDVQSWLFTAYLCAVVTSLCDGQLLGYS